MVVNYANSRFPSFPTVSQPFRNPWEAGHCCSSATLAAAARTRRKERMQPYSPSASEIDLNFSSTWALFAKFFSGCHWNDESDGVGLSMPIDGIYRSETPHLEPHAVEPVGHVAPPRSAAPHPTPDHRQGRRPTVPRGAEQRHEAHEPPSALVAAAARDPPGWPTRPSIGSAERSTLASSKCKCKPVRWSPLCPNRWCWTRFTKPICRRRTSRSVCRVSRRSFNTFFFIFLPISLRNIVRAPASL